MLPIIITCLIVIAWLMLTFHIGKRKEQALREVEAKKWEDVRTKELLRRAMKEYPDARVIDAVHLYYNTKLGYLIRAVSQEQKAELLTDRILLKRELDRMVEAEIHQDSGFVFSE